MFITTALRANQGIDSLDALMSVSELRGRMFEHCTPDLTDVQVSGPPPKCRARVVI